ncbi:MAG: PLP-dependent aminotransferase family protein [Euryarchaeota archaeon]|nr:PLP-dependent aminotransferase family protein [Euryarchaeota archaeon]
MQYDEEFSEIAKRLKASEIRELLKLTQQPEIISFAGGLPNPASFPLDNIKEIVESLIEKEGPYILQYGSTDGVNSFRDALASFMGKHYNVETKRENILITAGSQQALYLLAKIFVNPGDDVIIEAPTYIGILTAFQSYYPRYTTVEMDDEGMNTQLLEEKLKKMRADGKKPKLIYTIPTFQNPAGVTMTLERRKHLIELAEEYDVLVVEDDPYGELRYSGERLPLLKALDKNAHVIYLGTFSKILAPGMRLAHMIADTPIIQKAVLAKQGIDLCTNTFAQYIARDYIARGYLERHLPDIISLYKAHRDLMLDVMEDEFPEGVKWTRPDGGMFLWVTLPDGMDAEAMFTKAIENKVAYVVGSAFFPDRSHKNTMRLNFTYSTEEQIKEGIRRLGKVIREELP